MFRKLILFVVLTTWVISANATTKSVCKIMRKQSDELQSQLPIAVDYTTVLVGSTTLYSSSTCYITHKYLVDSKKYAQFLSSQNGLSNADNTFFMKSTEGKAAIKKQLEDTGAIARDTVLKELSKHKGIKLLYQHEFNDVAVGNFTTTVLDTTR